MAGNAAQEARRTLKPKSRRPQNGTVSRGQSPIYLGNSGDAVPQFSSSFAPTPPAASSFSFGAPQVANNPFSGFSSIGQDPAAEAQRQEEALKRQMGEGDESSRKRPFGNGFSSTMNSPSTNNIFGGQAAAATPSSSFSFGAPSGAPVFGNSQAQSQTPKPSFQFGPTGTQTNPTSSSNLFASTSAPSQTPTFSFGQPQTQGSAPASPSFGNGASPFGFPPTTTTKPTANTTAHSSSILAQAPTSTTPIFSFGSPAKAPAASETPAKSSSFTFGQQSQTPMVSQTPTQSTSFTFGTTPKAQPQSSAASIFSGNATPASTSLFGANATPTAGSPFKFGGDSSKTSTPSVPAISLFPSTSEASSSTPATSTLSSPSLFAGLGASSGSSKPLSSSDSNKEKPMFSFGDSAKPKESSAPGNSSSQSLFGNVAEKSGASSLFNTTSASQSQPTPAPSGGFVFQFGNSESAVGGSTGKTEQQKPGTNGSNSLFSSSSPSSQESKKDDSAKSTFTFGAQPTQPQASQPSSSSLFGSPKPAQSQSGGSSDPTTASGLNGTSGLKDSGSSPAKPGALFGNALDSPRTAASSFVPKHRPARPSPLSQSMTGSNSPDVERPTNAGTANSLSSISESPSKQSQADKDAAEKKKQYDAAKRLRSLNEAVKAALEGMPVTADISKLLVFYNTRRDEILKDVAKTKRKAVDDGIHEDGSVRSPTKRQRQNNGKGFISTGQSFRENEEVQLAQESYSATPTKSITQQQDRSVQATPRPSFESPSKQQSTTYGSTTPRGPPPKNVFAAQALKTPASTISKEPPQTEKPKAATSLFTAGTSTEPRNPPAKFSFEQPSQPSQTSLFATPKTNGTAREPSLPKQAAPSSQSQPSQTLFGSLKQSAAAAQVAKESPRPNGAGSSSLFGALNSSAATKQVAQEPPKSNGSGSSSLFGALNSSAAPKQVAQEQPKPSSSSLFGASNSPAAPKQVAKEPTKSNSLGSLISNGPSSSSQPESSMFGSANQRPLFASTSSSSQQSTLQPVAPPFGMTPAAAFSPAPSNKRKPESQLTKDKYEVSENNDSTTGTKRRATSQLTKDNFETAESAPSTPSGKRKADVQLTKDAFEAQNGSSGQKTPKTNGTPSGTSMLFKNIVDSPGQTTSPKKMFSLNKSDKSAARPNPFASLGVTQSPAIPSQIATPKASNASVSVFGSPVKSNETPKFPLFSGASSGSTTSTSAFAASSSAVPSASSSINTSSFDIAPKPFSSMFGAPSSSAATSVFGASLSAVTDKPASTNGTSPESTSKPASSKFAAQLSSTADPISAASSTALPDKSASTSGSAFGSAPKLALPTFAVPSSDSAAKKSVPAADTKPDGSGVSLAEQMRQKTEAKALQDAIEADYDSEDDGDKEEWIKNWKEKRAAKFQSNLKVPTFGTSASSNVSAAEQLRLKSEAKALEDALAADYDSEDDGDKEKWIEKWKAERAAKAKQLSEQSKPVFIPGMGFSFSSQDSKDSSPEPASSSKSPPKSIFEQAPVSSTDASRASSLGPTTSANGSVLNGPMPHKGFSAVNNIFGHLSDSGTDVAKDAEAEDDDQTTEEGSDGGEVNDDEKRDPTWDPAAEPEADSPDSPVEETGPGIASAKKSASPPKGSLFDRISKDSAGNLIRELPIENKENTQPSSPFNFFSNPNVDKTWKQDSPIKFGTSTAAPVANAATPAAQKSIGFPAFGKAPSTAPAASSSQPFGSKATETTQTKPFGSLFGSPAVSSNESDNAGAAKAPGASLFGSLSKPAAATPGSSLFDNLKSNESANSGPAKAPGVSLFGNLNAPTGSSLFAKPTSQPGPLFSSGNTAAADTLGSKLFGSTKPPPTFSFGDSKPASVGFGFGSTPVAPASLLSSAAASTSNSRASTPGAATTDNESNAGTEGSNDPDAEHHEQIKLTDSRAGEEDEEVLLECRAKALIFEMPNESKGGGWVPKGTGVFRILKHKETGSTRTLLRADPSANIVLNKGLLGSLNYAANGKTIKLLTAGEGATTLETWMLQVKTAELAGELAGVLEANKPKSA